jgi:large subunit ribosomal protein L5
MSVSSQISRFQHQSRLKSYYRDVIVPEMMKSFGFQNVMQVPKIQKIVVSTSDKDAINDSKIVDKMVEQVWLISGQKPVVNKAHNANAGFKLRQGMPLGCSVTLRREVMYSFLDRLVNIALPRMKDLEGLSPKQFDGHGNYSLGFKEQIIFPEIQYDKIDKIRGMNIAIVTNSSCTDEQARVLLKMFNFPFNQ